jgi:long-subunit fatty acid transport protein
VILVLLAAWASPAELYGFGARAMGRAQGGVSLPGDAGSALLNPAALAGSPRSQFFFGYSVVRFDFDPLPQVYWDTNRDGLLDGTDTPLNIGGIDPGDGSMLGVRRAFGPRFGVGLSLFAPTGRLLRLQTIEPRLPTYFMYQNRTQRYAMAVGFGAQPLTSLYIGAGVRLLSQSTLYASFTVDATVDGDPDSAQVEDVVSATVDVHDMTFDLRPAAIPVAGLQWKLGELFPKLEGVALGFTWRGAGGVPVEVILDAQINGHTEDIGQLDPMVIAGVAEALVSVYDHYVPQQVQFGGSFSSNDVFHTYVDVHHTRWGAMQLNYSQLVSASLDAGLVDLSQMEVTGGLTPRAQFRNTWAVRTGTELTLPPFDLPGGAGWLRPTFRGGFGYEPSPLVAQSADTALLDADRLIFGVGIGVEHGAVWGLLEGPIAWDGFFQYHSLASGSLERPATQELRAGYPVNGAAVPIGGRFYTGGMQWSIEY